MLIVAIAWMYVVILMAFTQETILAGVLTVLGYGLLPLSVVLYLMATPARRRVAERRRAQANAQAEADAQTKAGAQTKGNAQTESNAEAQAQAAAETTAPAPSHHRS